MHRQRWLYITGGSAPPRGLADDSEVAQIYLSAPLTKHWFVAQRNNIFNGTPFLYKYTKLGGFVFYFRKFGA
jgi:hypothetical protein